MNAAARPRIDEPRSPAGAAGDQLSIRDAVEADLPALIALYDAAGVEAPELAREPAALAAAWQRIAAVPGARILLATMAGQPVGTLTYFVLPLLTHGGGAAALVEAVAVAPDQQGRGIGRALMQAALALAEEAGCYKLALSSNLKRSQAHAFYEHLGFERHGISFFVAPPGELR